MRLTFWRRRAKVIRFGKDARRLLEQAGGIARPAGMDSIHILAAMLSRREVARVLDDVAGATAAIRLAVDARANEPLGDDGFMLDGKAAIEAAMRCAMAREKNASIEDLLLGLATADCEARRLLNRHGITAELLEARLGGAPSLTGDQPVT